MASAGRLPITQDPPHEIEGPPREIVQEAAVYLELRYAPRPFGNSKAVYFNPKVTGALLDSLGKPVPEQGRGGSGGGRRFPQAEWVTLPVRFHASAALDPK